MNDPDYIGNHRYIEVIRDPGNPPHLWTGTARAARLEGLHEAMVRWSPKQVHLFVQVDTPRQEGGVVLSVARAVHKPSAILDRAEYVCTMPWPEAWDTFVAHVRMLE